MQSYQFILSGKRMQVFINSTKCAKMRCLEKLETLLSYRLICAVDSSWFYKIYFLLFLFYFICPINDHWNFSDKKFKRSIESILTKYCSNACRLNNCVHKKNAFLSKNITVIIFWFRKSQPVSCHEIVLSNREKKQIYQLAC